MAYQRYTDVAAAGEAAQRRLLEAGEPVEQVWAAWALGVALGRAANPVLTATMEASPEPGVRRQLAVILAGYGEAVILRRLAEHDPDAHVRATAVQYLTRITNSADLTFTEWLHTRLSVDTAAAVLVAVMEGAQAAQRRLPATALEPLLSAPDREVRQAALTLLIAQHAFVMAVKDWLKQRIVEEPDHFLRQHIREHFIGAGEASELLAVAALAGNPVQSEVFSELERRGVSFSWGLLEPLADRNRPELNEWLYLLLRPGEVIPLPWLLDVILRAYRWPAELGLSRRTALAAAWRVSLAAEAHLREMLPLLDPIELQAAEWDGLAAVAAGLREYAAEVEREAYEEPLSWGDVPTDAAAYDSSGDARLELLAELEAFVARRPDAANARPQS